MNSLQSTKAAMSTTLVEDKFSMDRAKSRIATPSQVSRAKDYGKLVSMVGSNLSVKLHKIFWHAQFKKIIGWVLQLRGSVLLGNQVFFKSGIFCKNLKPPI